MNEWNIGRLIQQTQFVKIPLSPNGSFLIQMLIWIFHFIWNLKTYLTEGRQEWIPWAFHSLHSLQLIQSSTPFYLPTTDAIRSQTSHTCWSGPPLLTVPASWPPLQVDSPGCASRLQNPRPYHFLPGHVLVVHRRTWFWFYSFKCHMLGGNVHKSVQAE